MTGRLASSCFCVCIIHEDPIIHTDGKLGPCLLKTCLVRYHGWGSYHLLDQLTGQFYRSCDVIFEEGSANRTITNCPKWTLDADDTFDFQDPSYGIPTTPTPITTPIIPPTPTIAAPKQATPTLPPPVTIKPPAPIEPRRSTHDWNPTSNMWDSVASEQSIEVAKAEGLAWATNKRARAGVFLSNVNPDDLWIPRTYEEAMTRPDLWGAPIKKGMD